MPDEKDKLVKPPNPNEGPKGITVTGGSVKIHGKSRLHSALSQAPAEDATESFRKAAQAVTSGNADKLNDPLTAVNRIAIMADISGSMASSDGSAQSKIELLKIALGGFLNQVNFDGTSIAIYTFPLRNDGDHYSDDDGDPLLGSRHGISYRLSFDKMMLQMAVNGLSSGGGTPMHSTMQKVLDELPLTRGIIISDGEADRADSALDYARKYAQSETIVDTVHIGTSPGGEKLLQEIAKITGGIYIKFDKVEAFAKAFGFLTPEGRATLMLNAGPGASLESKAAVARLLGAKEVK